MPDVLRIASTLALTLALAGCKDGSATAASASDGMLLSPYLAIGDSLAADTLDGLDKFGAAVVEAADGKAGQAGVSKLLQGAGRVGAQDIATARSAYKTMSAGMIDYLKANPDKQAGHMIVHCTMTFDGKGGLWVQKEGQVMNPYEGAMMLHCGDKLDWDAALPET